MFYIIYSRLLKETEPLMNIKDSDVPFLLPSNNLMKEKQGNNDLILVSPSMYKTRSYHCSFSSDAKNQGGGIGRCEVICNMKGLLLTPSQVNVSKPIYQQKGGERRNISGLLWTNSIRSCVCWGKGHSKEQPRGKASAGMDPGWFTLLLSTAYIYWTGWRFYSVSIRSEGDNLCK